MTERPILMSAPMVRACLREVDPKGQTRRVITPQPEVSAHGNLAGAWLSRPLSGILLPKVADIAIHCDYGQPGNRLWVRETHYRYGKWVRAGKTKAGRPRWRFRAWGGRGVLFAEQGDEQSKAPISLPKKRSEIGWHKRPSIFMPRWACRLVLEVAEVRVERLQGISVADVDAEGLDGYSAAGITHAQRKISPVPEHWIGGADEGLSYCRPCGEKEIKNLEKKNPGKEYTLDGGYRTEGDGQAFCETCRCHLDNSFTGYGCESELDHFDQYGFDVDNPSDCLSFQNILAASVWKGGEHSERVRKLAYRALWDSLNKARGFGWEKNPWVWCVSFRRAA